MDDLTQLPDSLLDVLLRPGASVSKTTAQDGLVSVDDVAIYQMLAGDIARMTAAEGGPGMVVLIDADTAVHTDAADALRASAAAVCVFGPVPDAWRASGSVKELPRLSGEERGGVRNHLLLAVSPRVCLMLVCERVGDSFRGVWTSCRLQAKRVLDALASAWGGSVPAEMVAALAPGAVEVSLTCALRLTSMQTRQLTLRQRDIAMDKDELSSVLNILKAVSARRRAHDILYVFVEQIARAVTMDRCSVLRVWGGEDKGHVLASHEDESVSDLVIDLSKYPEIRRSIESRQKVIINDTRRDPLLRKCAEDLQKAGITSLIVIPIVLFDPNIGSFLLRAARIGGQFTLREISFCEIVAEAAANALERGQLFESIQKANERLEHLAITDGLTGLFNHRYFRQRLEDEFERARRYSLPLSCMIMDIDNFKRINDTYGHLQGDVVLRGIAASAQNTVRKSDVVARYGGEEFVVIMPQTGAEGACAQAERVRREVADSKFYGFPEGFRVTVSIGVAVFDPAAMLDCEALLRVADSALYTAKREGKDRVIVG